MVLEEHLDAGIDSCLRRNQQVHRGNFIEEAQENSEENSGRQRMAERADTNKS